MERWLWSLVAPSIGSPIFIAFHHSGKFWQSRQLSVRDTVVIHTCWFARTVDNRIATLPDWLAEFLLFSFGLPSERASVWTQTFDCIRSLSDLTRSWEPFKRKDEQLFLFIRLAALGRSVTFGSPYNSTPKNYAHWKLNFRMIEV